MMLKPGFGSASRTLLAVLLLPLASPAVADGPERSGVVRFTRFTVTPLHVNANLLTNPGFEEGAGGGIPVGWEWSARNTDATCRTDTTTPHLGKQSIRLTNGTEFGSHVYGMLWAREPVMLHPGRRYTLSAG